MLTPLQRKVAELIAGLDAAERFGLAGGAAMILRGDVDRQTFEVRRLQDGLSFVRMSVEDSGEVVEVDLAADARLFPLETEGGLPVLSRPELAVDKVLAVFGRAEARDFVDLASVIDQFGLEKLFRLASEKDPGFSIEVFEEMLGRFGRLRPEEFGLPTERYRDLRFQVDSWRSQALELARGIGFDQGWDC